MVWTVMYMFNNVGRCMQGEQGSNYHPLTVEETGMLAATAEPRLSLESSMHPSLRDGSGTAEATVDVTLPSHDGYSGTQFGNDRDAFRF